MGESKLQAERIPEITIGRCILIILVAFGHSVIQQVGSSRGGYFYDTLVIESGLSDARVHVWLLNAAFCIYQFHMKAFIATSGLLFARSMARGKYDSLKKLLIDKVPRLLIPFVFMNVFILFPMRVFTGYYKENFLDALVYDLLLLDGSNYLWYLIALLICFIICYCVEAYYNGPRLFKWCVIISLALIRGAFPKFFYAGFENLIWFYLGLCIYEKLEYIRAKANWWKVLLFLVGCIASRQIVVKSPQMENAMYYISGFCGIFFLLNFSVMLDKYTRLIDSKLVNSISSNALGIYLYGDPLNGVINYLAYMLIGVQVFAFSRYSIVLHLFKLVATIMIPLLICKLLKKAGIKYLA